MAREVKGYEQGEERQVPYIPKCFDNRKDPNPIEVWIRTPTEDLKRRCSASVADSVTIRKDDDGKTTVDAINVDIDDALAWQRYYVRHCVTKIKNYGPIRGKQITTGNDLAAFGETALLLEVAMEIHSEFSLTEDEKKSSNELSDSSAPATAPSDGIAESADEAGPQRFEDAA